MAYVLARGDYRVGDSVLEAREGRLLPYQSEVNRNIFGVGEIIHERINR